jgi:hypothetical protein
VLGRALRRREPTTAAAQNQQIELPHRVSFADVSRRMRVQQLPSYGRTIGSPAQPR